MIRILTQVMSKRESKKNAPKPSPLKILMLHGYRQNEMAFRERSGGMRKALKSQAEFIFCEAPHIIPAIKTEDTAEESTNQRGWWFSANDSSYNAHEHTDVENGFTETLDYLNKFFETSGPFDGILGFSQGACLASILTRISSNNLNGSSGEKYKSIRFNFAIIVAGYRSRQSQHTAFYDLDKKISLPTLQIYGNGDKVPFFERNSNISNLN